jgi:hypothetical protein
MGSSTKYRSATVMPFDMDPDESKKPREGLLHGSIPLMEESVATMETLTLTSFTGIFRIPLLRDSCRGHI